MSDKICSSGPIGYACLGDAEHETELVTMLELKGFSGPEEYFGHKKFIPIYTDPQEQSPEDIAEESERLTAHIKEYRKDFEKRIGIELADFESYHLEETMRDCIDEWSGESRQKPKPQTINEIKRGLF